MTSLSQPLAKYMGTAINRSLKQIENDLSPRQIGELLADDQSFLCAEYRPDCIELQAIQNRLDEEINRLLADVLDDLWIAVCQQRFNQ